MKLGEMQNSEAEQIYEVEIKSWIQKIFQNTKTNRFPKQHLQTKKNPLASVQAGGLRGSQA